MAQKALVILGLMAFAREICESPRLSDDDVENAKETCRMVLELLAPAVRIDWNSWKDLVLSFGLASMSRESGEPLSFFGDVTVKSIAPGSGRGHTAVMDLRRLSNKDHLVVGLQKMQKSLPQLSKSPAVTSVLYDVCHLLSEMEL